ncbi:hypothetical protein ACR1PO_15625 [Chryseobacterium sp. RRHN12]|uniref:hypothetical protein n=1 Tax=Chryseobacterium sp. RRHN12 TaxID=3437884 RepID=UPI003D9AD988
MNKDELLKIYSAYLPYELKGRSIYNANDDEQNEDCILTLKDGLNNQVGIDDWVNQYSYPIKPYLYDLSYLTKEIEHEGETFVPMIKLLELQETNAFSRNAIIKNATSFNNEKVIDCKSKTFKMHPDAMTEHKVRYLVETSNMGTLVYSLTYDEHFDRFYMADETRKLILGVGHQRQMFEKLYEWKLNVFNLPEDQFINKATLTNK